MHRHAEGAQRFDEFQIQRFGLRKLCLVAVKEGIVIQTLGGCLVFWTQDLLSRCQRALIERFSLSVFAGWAPAWLRADSENRAALERSGVDRVILLMEPPYDPSQIRAASRLLAG